MIGRFSFSLYCVIYGGIILIMLIYESGTRWKLLLSLSRIGPFMAFQDDIVSRTIVKYLHNQKIWIFFCLKRTTFCKLLACRESYHKIMIVVQTENLICSMFIIFFNQNYVDWNEKSIWIEFLEVLVFFIRYAMTNRWIIDHNWLSLFQLKNVPSTTQSLFVTSREQSETYLLEMEMITEYISQFGIFQIKDNTKLFESARESLKLVGFIQNYGGYRYYPFSMQHLRATAIYSVVVVLTFIFVIHSADSPAEYMDSFYMLAVSFSIFVSHISMTFNVTKIFQLVDGCEKIFGGESRQFC